MKHFTEIFSFLVSPVLQWLAMNPTDRICYLFDEFGQQIGPLTLGETLRHLELAQSKAFGRRSRLKVWTLGWPIRLQADEALARLRRRPPAPTA